MDEDSRHLTRRSISRDHVIVVGDICTELLVYPSSEQTGQPTYHDRRCFRGGRLITEILRISLSGERFQVDGLTVPMWESESQKLSYNAICEMEFFNYDDNGQKSGYKLKRRQQLSTKSIWYCPSLLPSNEDSNSLLVFEDAKSGFSNVDDAISFLQHQQPRWLLYHAARRPLGTGEIWDYVRRGPYRPESGEQDPHSLIVVIRAEDLRAEGIDLSYGLSWEKTCENFVENLGSNGKLDTIVTCANLIVLFGCDGAIYHRGRQMSKPQLIFDPSSQEGQFSDDHIGIVPGLFEAFIGGLAAKIAQSPQATSIGEGIRHGLSVARRLAKFGFECDNIEEGPRYPIERMTTEDSSIKTLETISIPSRKISRGDYKSWSILRQNIGDPVQVAHQIVTKGLRSNASWIPMANFKHLTVIDRWEIESFRTIFNAIREYLSRPQTKPLNIGVFGSNGSGKYFAAVQVATAAAESSGRQIRHMRFDLSQFSSSRDLCGSFHAVRDCSLSGVFPIVYIQGFDTALGKDELGWLTHLLPPMHAGQVFDQGEMRHIGPAVFLHGSSTTLTLEAFSGLSTVLRRQSFVSWENEEPLVPQGYSPKQEFLGCLHAFVNVHGLNKIDATDELYPVRRAIILRALLEEREPLLRSGDNISVDESVLHGLLMVDQYRYGLRSLRTIVSMSKVTGKRHFEKAALPPKMQLSLHLDHAKFVECCRYSVLPEDAIDGIAKILHETYLTCIEAMAKTEAKKREFQAQPSSQPWFNLDEEYKESSRKQAIDIPRKLSTISCFISKGKDDRDAVFKFESHELEKLAEQEHERFNAERLQGQWHLGERDEERRANPFLKPWRELEDEWQEVDRKMVETYIPAITAIPGKYQVYRSGKTVTMATAKLKTAKSSTF